MDAENDKPLDTRTPTVDDLVALCRHLNDEGAQYIVVGGMAMIQHGFFRTTEDIDLLIETSPQNQQKVIAALMHLPDQAAREIEVGDVDDYIVIRVADEYVVDLMKAACGISYPSALSDTIIIDIRGVPIPMPTPQLLLRLKQTVRAKDVQDREFLEAKLKNMEEAKESR